MTINFDSKKNYKVIGTNPIRHDGYDKVTGRAIYGADVKLPGLIFPCLWISLLCCMAFKPGNGCPPRLDCFLHGVLS
jgi:hypothetical protein